MMKRRVGGSPRAHKKKAATAASSQGTIQSQPLSASQQEEERNPVTTRPSRSNARTFQIGAILVLNALCWWLVFVAGIASPTLKTNSMPGPNDFLSTTSLSNKNVNNNPCSRSNADIEKDKLIQDLLYRNAMLTARSTAAIQGPVPLTTLPKSQQDLFAAYEMELEFDPKGVWPDGTGGKSGKYQVPTIVSTQNLMHYDTKQGSWEKKWSKTLLDILIGQVKDAKEDISPRSYPGCALQIQQVLEDYVVPLVQTYSNTTSNVQQQQTFPRIMIGGSISPWVESIVLAITGVPKVWVVDWQPIEMDEDEDRIECLLMPKLTMQRPTQLFDVIISYSSIEHDGLGRYGDPINPHGDLAAVAEYYTLLNPNGLLILGIPQVQQGRVEQSNHRMYGASRVEALRQGFDVLEQVRHNTPQLAKRFHKDRESVRTKYGWQRQPVMVLKNRNDQLPVLLNVSARSRLSG